MQSHDRRDPNPLVARELPERPAEAAARSVHLGTPGAAYPPGSYSVRGATITFHQSRAVECARPDTEPGTTYFSPAPVHGTVRYLDEPLDAGIRARLVRESGALEYHSRKSTYTPDKGQMRELASLAACLAQPEHWRVPTVPHRRIGPIEHSSAHALTFKGIDFDAMPIEALGAEGAPRSILFLDAQQGFRITARGGSLFVESGNPAVQAALGMTDGAVKECSAAELRAGLARLRGSEFAVSRVADSPDNVHNSYELLRSVVSDKPDGTYFLKDVNGSRGHGVVKIELKGGDIESIQLPRSASRCIEEAVGVSHESLPPRQVIRALMERHLLSDLMLEAAIPTERVNGFWSEQRAVFHFHNGPHYLCAYSKLGSEHDDDVVPNRSQGGDAEPVRTSFERILAARTDLHDETLAAAVEETALRLRALTQTFAERFFEEAKKVDRHYYNGMFAVDVCPVWNEAERRIDFVLLEVQAGPGTEGATGNLSPEEQQAVDAYNRAEADSPDMFDHY